MKKQWIVSGIVGLMFLLVLTSFLSFRLGKQSNRTTEEENAEAEALCFGNKSIVLSPMTNGALCDFSTQDIPFSLVSLADDLLEQIAGLEQVEEASVCYLRIGGAVFHGMDGFSDGMVLGVDEGLLSTAGMMVETGRGITERDVADESRIALLDSKAVQKLFHGEEPIGNTVELEGILYQVVGIVGFGTARKGNGMILIPESTWSEVYRYEEPKSVVVRVEKQEEMGAVGEQGGRILNSMIPAEEVVRYAAW